MPDTLITATLIFLALVLYVSAGRAHWVLMDRTYTAAHPELADTCEFRAGLKAGHIGAHFTRWTFVLSWPLWLAVGRLNAQRERLSGR